MDTLTEDEEPERPEGALEVGLWCGRCFLPSGIRWQLWGTTSIDPTPFRLGTVIVCHDCEARLGEDGRVLG